MELMEISALVDEYDETRNHRLEADKQAEYLKRQETDLADRLIHVMHDQSMFYVAGTVKRVKMTPTQKPKVEDWVAFYGFMVEHEATDLLQRRLHEGALKDRIEDGQDVPGITYVEINKLSLAKI